MYKKTTALFLLGIASSIYSMEDPKKEIHPHNSVLQNDVICILKDMNVNLDSFLASALQVENEFSVRLTKTINNTKELLLHIQNDNILSVPYRLPYIFMAFATTSKNIKQIFKQTKSAQTYLNKHNFNIGRLAIHYATFLQAMQLPLKNNDDLLGFMTVIKLKKLASKINSISLKIAENITNTLSADNKLDAEKVKQLSDIALFHQKISEQLSSYETSMEKDLIALGLLPYIFMETAYFGKVIQEFQQENKNLETYLYNHYQYIGQIAPYYARYLETTELFKHHEIALNDARMITELI